MLVQRVSWIGALLVTCALCSAPARGVPTRTQGAIDAAVRSNPKLVESRYLSPAEVRARTEYELERGISFPKLVRGNPKQKVIALTFDDGPHPSFTPRLLDTLKALGVPATFFVVGKMVDQHPELVQREAAEGHEVANHTYDHVRLPMLGADGIETQLRRGAEAIERALGSPTRLYRPPGGEYDDDVVAVTKRLGDVMVLWTDDPADFAQPGAQQIEERLFRRIGPGGILLLHDGIEQTLDILPDLVGRLRVKGYRFVTCSQMALERGVVKTGGPVIRPPNQRGGVPRR